jgi:putative SOS response-associated peptidase YedK
MCGRYVRRSDKQRIAEHFRLDPNSIPELGNSYNVAPQTYQPVVRLHRDTGEREIVLMRWGLVPYWARDAKLAYSTINAKAETVASSPSFREAFRKRRCLEHFSYRCRRASKGLCGLSLKKGHAEGIFAVHSIRKNALVPADAFYEWQKLDVKTKQPFAIAMKDGSPYAFAGLWDRWRDPLTREPLETFTILTTDANELLQEMHTRMPVILEPKDYDRWLTPGDPARLPTDLLRAYPAERMTAWKVDRQVGNVRNDTTDCIAPLVDTTPQAELEGGLDLRATS